MRCGWVGAAAMLGIASVPAVGNLVVNGGFEQPVGRQIIYAGGILPGWTVGGDGGVKVGDFWQAAQGVQAVDLSGVGTGAVIQHVPTVVGQRYVLSFAMAGNPDGVPVVKTLAFRAGDNDTQTLTFDTTGRSDSQMGWVRHSYPFLATGDSTEIVFSSENTTIFGPTLDDVHVNAVPPGDADEDLSVGFSDLLAVAQHYGSTAADWTTGDFNADGTVNFKDLLILAQNYGKDASDPPAAASAASVPEPAWAIPAALACACVKRPRRGAAFLR